MLKQRLITGLILAPLALAGLFLLDPIPFSLFIAAIIVLGAWEWAQLSGLSSQFQRVTYAGAIAGVLYLSRELNIETVLFVSLSWWAVATVLVMTYPSTCKLWSGRPIRLLLGVIILLPFWHALVFLRAAQISLFGEVAGLWLVLYILGLVWSADIGAYFAGKTWGKKKLAPRVSPGKSWAGAWGGLGSSLVLALSVSFSLSLPMLQLLALSFVTVLAAAMSIIGDLTESMFKRNAGIKDSSQLLPGHGGILDRIDSLLVTAPLVTFIFMYLAWVA